MIEHIQGKTFHKRRGAVKNSFAYGVDYVLTDLGAENLPLLFSRNRFNLWSLWDRNHGGARDDGRGVAWFCDVLVERGFPLEGTQLLLLAQPRFLWMGFNPVSFWIAMRGGQPCAIVAEVNNTFGHRHCYFCAHDDFSVITKNREIVADKLMHVSPFQDVAGTYRFSFDISKTAINIRILFENGDAGVVATLTGPRKPATNASLLWAALRRPFGAGRVVGLIHWQALVLYFKRAPFRRTPSPPAHLISDSHLEKRTQHD